MSKRDLHRVQMDMPQHTIDQLDALRERLHAASRAEVIRRALNLLDIVTVDGVEVVLRGSGADDRVLVVL